MREYNVDNLIIAGGVSANKGIRDEFIRLSHEYGFNLTIPKLEYCTDNAAMIGITGYFKYQAGDFCDIAAEPFARMQQ